MSFYSLNIPNVYAFEAESDDDAAAVSSSYSTSISTSARFVQVFGGCWKLGKNSENCLAVACQLPFNFLSHCKHFTWRVAKFNILASQNVQINYRNKQNQTKMKKKNQNKRETFFQIYLRFEMRFLFIAGNSTETEEMTSSINFSYINISTLIWARDLIIKCF